MTTTSSISSLLLKYHVSKIVGLLTRASHVVASENKGTEAFKAPTEFLVRRARRKWPLRDLSREFQVQSRLRRLFFKSSVRNTNAITMFILVQPIAGQKKVRAVLDTSRPAVVKASFK